MNVLLTGAAGFLGSAIRRSRLNNHTIVSVSRALAVNSSELNIIGIDLSKPLNPKSLPDSVDVIIHLAQSERYRDFPEGMQDMQAINIAAMVNLLEYARNIGVNQFIYASTGSVYEPIESMQFEDAYIAPTAPYPVTKYCAELLSHPYKAYFNVTILRLFFLYGPNQSGAMISNIAQNMKVGGSVKLQGSDEGLIFCPSFVDDVAEVFVQAVEKNVEGVFNVASPNSLSLYDAAIEIADCLDVEPKFEYDQSQPSVVYKPSLLRLKSWLDVNAVFRPFSQGVRDTIGSSIIPLES